MPIRYLVSSLLCSVAFISISYAQQQDTIQQDPVFNCIKALNTDQRFTPIAGKIPLISAIDTTFAMLADESKPTKAERQAIADWANARTECMKSGQAYWMQHYPLQLVAVFSEGESDLMAMTADLYNSKITYGEFCKRRQAAQNDITAKIGAVIQQIKSTQQAQQQAPQSAPQQAQQQDQQPAECASIRSEIARQQNIAMVGSSQLPGMYAMVIQAKARTNIANLESQASDLGCNAAFRN